VTTTPRIPLEISPSQHQLLREIREFLSVIHCHIDPDMFDIKPAHVSWLEQSVAPDVEWLTLVVSRDELFVLETMVMAACEYSLRKSTGVTLHATEDNLQALEHWIAEQARRFSSTTTLH
jgi:hypothetical protein